MEMVLRKESQLTVVIPTRTSLLVGEVVGEIKALPIEAEVAVVGYQISDEIRQAILNKGGTFIDEPRKGKGIAVVNAFSEVTTEYVMILDADGTYPVLAIPELLKALQEGADAVVGCRYWKIKGSMTFVHKLGNFGLSLLASIIYRHRIKDLCSGMWGFKTEVVQKFNLVSKGFTLEADFFVNTNKNNCQLAQVPIRYVPRKGGKAKTTMWDGLKIGWFLVRRRFY